MADRDQIDRLGVQHVADRELIMALRDELTVDQDKIENLEIGLMTARRIGTAMGVLMSSLKITEDQAFALLRDASQRTHRKLRDLAQDVVDTGAIPAAP